MKIRPVDGDSYPAVAQDEKYRNVLTKSPILIETIVNLLEKVVSTDSKRLILRVINRLTKSSDTKSKIGTAH